MDACSPFLRPGISVRQKIASSRFLTFSLLIHVIIVVAAGTVVIMEPPIRERSRPGVTLTEEHAEQELPPASDLPLLVPALPEPSNSLPASESLAVASSESSKLALTPVTSLDSSRPAPSFAAPASGGVPNPAAPSQIPPSMASRFGPGRMALGLDRGMKRESEEAVIRALRWLVKTQNEDGSWGSEYPSAMTGLALLCFLGHGDTAETFEYGPAIGKAVEWLLRTGTEFDGRFSLVQGGWGSNSGVYEHAIATYALGEYAAITHDTRAELILRKAVAYIVEGQGADGGWSYGYGRNPESDTSVTGWQIQALKTAHLTQLAIPGVETALDRSMLDLRRVQGEKGGFGYTHAEDRYSLTGVGVLCAALWAGPKERAVREGLRFMQAREQPVVEYRADSADLYAWYYNTQACATVDGAPWERWKRQFQSEIAGHQNADGSWPPTAGKSPGGELQRKADGAGPTYRTCLCALMLESFYRFAPAGGARPF